MLTLAFSLYPLLAPGSKLLNTFRSAIMLADVISTFFMAIPKSVVQYTEDDDHDNPLIRKRERSFTLCDSCKGQILLGHI